MRPPGETDDEQDGEQDGEQGGAAKEPHRAAEEEPRGDPPASDVGEPQTLSFLFLAAAGALALLLAVIALIAFAAMSR